MATAAGACDGGGAKTLITLEGCFLHDGEGKLEVTVWGIGKVSEASSIVFGGVRGGAFIAVGLVGHCPHSFCFVGEVAPGSFKACANCVQSHVRPQRACGQASRVYAPDTASSSWVAGIVDATDVARWYCGVAEVCTILASRACQLSACRFYMTDHTCCRTHALGLFQSSKLSRVIGEFLFYGFESFLT